jgi:preprotein translocase subunit SecF
MIWGVVIGTYSSICLAVPLLLYLDLRRRGASGREPGEAAEETP